MQDTASSRSPFILWLSRIAVALPDIGSAGFFAALWVAPTWMGLSTVRQGLLMMIVEFLLIHASVFLGHSALARGLRTSVRMRALLGFGLIYGLFIAAWALVFESWWPILAFVWLLGAKFSDVIVGKVVSPEKAQRITTGWALSGVTYIGGVIFTSAVPMPRLGLGDAVRAQLDLPGSGLWIDHPEKVLAFGVLYFAVQAASKFLSFKLPTAPARPVRLRG